MTKTDGRSVAGEAGPRRNIVLLSDGTGNSAGKLNKTNVWWLYQALDLGDDDQIAFYDGGVGTSGVKLLQLLGGAFGWGLSRNVRHLYGVLCRHYREGDQIYIFGFSRGAFTARTLAALIVKCGLLDCRKSVPVGRGKSLQLNTCEGLEAGVKFAYRSYRRGYFAPVAWLWRRLRDLVLTPVPLPDTFRQEYSLAEPARISFIGVWDTVDAVGLPVDELSTMIDHIFYPHRFPDQNLSPQVDRACHAIAVDDERDTFHPVLWNERGCEDSSRITQVWFAGMHSNVGGGYPDDDLARVSLQWMIGQAGYTPGGGLRFDADSVRAIDQRAQPLGKMYDSRRGLGVYYRYSPRNIASLCHDEDNEVLIGEPKIHHSVLKRIAENTTGYAPAGLPDTYRLVDAQGVVSGPNPTTYESAAERSNRAALLMRVQNHIFWRRVLYYLLVLTTVALVLMPCYWPPIPGAEPQGLLQSVLAWLFGWLPAVLPGFLSSCVGAWTDAWTQSAPWFLCVAAIYGFLLWRNGLIAVNIQRLSEIAWWHIKRCPKPKPPTPGVGRFENMAGRIRHDERLKALRRFSIKRLVPTVVLAMVALIVLGTAYRIGFHLPTVANGLCAQWLPADQPPPVAIDRARQILLDARVPCIDTGIKLEAGRRYRVSVVAKDWQDGGSAASPAGLWHPFNPVFMMAIPARRHLTLPWFALVGEIGRDSGDAFPINLPSFVFTPPRDGGLYLYVNDAIDAFGAQWDTYYRNNQGTATITVTPED